MDTIMIMLIPAVLIGILMGMVALIYKLDKKINKRKGGE